MFHNLANTLKDLFGINKVVLYRTFKEWNWSKFQPMFNVMEVEPGTEGLFEKFLAEANETSGPLNSPVSLGPFKVEDQSIYIYVTHYGSTFRFMQVMMALLFKGLSAMRAKATHTTSWTYCHFEGTPELQELQEVYVLGVKGNVDPLIHTLHQKNISIASTNRMKFNARGKARANTYLVLAKTEETLKTIQEYFNSEQEYVLYAGKNLNTPSMTPLKFRKDFSYARLSPTLVHENCAASSEIARWVLEMNDLLYTSEPYAPGFSNKKVNQVAGTTGFGANPALINTDALIYTPESIIRYVDQRNPPEKRLFPEETALSAEVQKWYDLFTGDLDQYVSSYLYAELFADSDNAKELFKQQLHGWAKMKISWRLGFIRKSLDQHYKFSSKPKEEWLIDLQKIFDQVAELLSDGRTFLTGERLTAADIAFTAIAGKLLIPKESGAAITKINQIPFELRDQIFKLRETQAGQYALRIYQQYRPQPDPAIHPPKEPGPIDKFVDRLEIFFTGRQYKAFYFLQKRIPVLKLGFLKLAVVSRADLVTELLDRDNDFTVEEINGQKMADQNGAFYLGFDRNNPQFDRERNFVRRATKKGDLEIIRNYVRTHSDEILKNALPLGKLDVAETLTGTVLVGLLDHYFGVSAPTQPRMKKWCTDLFYDLFLNFTNDKEIHETALESARERRAWELKLITERKADLAAGKEIPDNILNRLILQQQEQENTGIWFDDEMIRRNIGGLLTGIMATTNKATVFVLEDLFKRPDDLKGAIKAAKEHDMDKVYGYVAESLRFNPVQPGVIRFCENEQFLKGSGSKSHKIKSGYKTIALTSGAMFTPDNFIEPKSYDPDRAAGGALYMNWGYGLHLCYGNYINMVTIPEFVAAVLRLPNVRPVKGRTGRGSGLQIGPFPTNYVVQFG